MAKIFSNSKELNIGFSVKANLPVDDRLCLDSSADLYVDASSPTVATGTLVDQAYDLMIVGVKVQGDDPQTYILKDRTPYVKGKYANVNESNFYTYWAEAGGSAKTTKLKGYVKGTDISDVSSGDTINQAFSKVEVQMDHKAWSRLEEGAKDVSTDGSVYLIDASTQQYTKHYDASLGNYYVYGDIDPSSNTFYPRFTYVYDGANWKKIGGTYSTDEVPLRNFTQGTDETAIKNTDTINEAFSKLQAQESTLDYVFSVTTNRLDASIADVTEKDSKKAWMRIEEGLKDVSTDGSVYLIDASTQQYTKHYDASKGNYYVYGDVDPSTLQFFGKFAYVYDGSNWIKIGSIHSTDELTLRNFVQGTDETNITSADTINQAFSKLEAQANTLDFALAAATSYLDESIRKVETNTTIVGAQENNLVSVDASGYIKDSGYFFDSSSNTYAASLIDIE